MLPYAQVRLLLIMSMFFLKFLSRQLSVSLPDIMIVSAGQDILSDDPLGMMGINPEDFEVLTRMLVHAARVPLALVLEGGYGPSHGEAVRSIFAALMSEGPVNTREFPRVTQNPLFLT